ncbi:hypothetical protein LEP48_08810 [Isoptericola sp. NEAU-Y5]|uniref:Rod shape-determining protein MreD n=1 Tax=Isoptericola luteus TaxID=2879484 RepID=A0ABS7ZGL6_9MICO|nr:DUF6580 family putative transport protein [Isoptericola sp. NEAU-Y5]MCA5893451.1 hypothetical protein [Isoptericola sp. NEAU-Y5]
MSTVLKYVVVAVLAVVSIAWRDLNLHTFLAPGVELVTVLAVASAVLLPRVPAVAVPLVTVAVGDVVLGSSSAISLYVWVAWCAVAVGALALRAARSRRATLALGAGFGAAASTLFFLVSNFGTWMLGRGEWYADSLSGLLAAYAAGVPFYLVPLGANLVLVPVAALAAHALRASSAVPAPSPLPVR